MEPTNQEALTYFKTFIKADEKIAEINPITKSIAFKTQLFLMEINLNKIKIIEPDFDASTLEDKIEKYNSIISSTNKIKSLKRDLISLNNGIDSLFDILNETKLDFNNIDFQIVNSTKAIKRTLSVFKLNHINYDISDFEDKIINFETKLRSKLEKASNLNKETKELSDDLFNVLKLKQLSYRDCEDEGFICGSHNLLGNSYLPDYIWSQAGIDKLQSIFNSYINRLHDFLKKYNIYDLSDFYLIYPNGEVTFQYGQQQNSKAQIIISYLREYARDSKPELNIAKTELMAVNETTDFVVETYFNKQIKALEWVHASKVFPKHAKILEVGSKYQEVLNAYGNMDFYKEKLRQNSLKHINRVKTPNAAKQNDEIELLVKQAFELKGWNEDVLKVSLLGNDWRLERNSDWKIGRVFDVAIISKQKSNACILYKATIRQEHNGGNYSAPFISSYTSKSITKENI